MEMAEMIRKQFYLEPGQEALLKQRARELGVTEAELVREAVNLYAFAGVSTHRDPGIWAREKDFIEALRKKGPLEGGRRWRREDLYDR